MRKIFLLLSVVGTLAFTSCNNDDDVVYVDNDTISEVFEVANVNFIETGDYTVTIPLEPQIYSSDVVLVYRLSGIDPLGADIWEQVPTRYYLAEGTLDYFTDFSVNSVSIYLDADFDPMLRQDFSLNQVFRIVIVPGYFSDTVNVNDYDAVMSALSASGGNQEIQVIETR
ncbi:hypothetical protein E0W68_08975 [Flavobacterium salilacus subsp. salilacus]|uniref:hypothetical protein n=1 Tax=Flavobacterium TaxID=237 RepID=UPI00107545A1|nr:MULTISPECIES: hypothetical protein [Flavobacterium]KAF2518449.1 hypothetical protein E0W68_08975 [Flavobacterium salilacus subsp. salilacus]MBE1615087.1 hypothetical protein [Flavobacterium sp. SaA2.13]